MAKKILVIDDDPDVMDLVQTALSSAGYEVHAAYDGKQGVEKIKKQRPDLLIMDLTMPIMDGWAVLIALKKDPNYTAIPVMIITSSKEIQNIEKAKKLGVQSYLVKPFDPQKMIKIARHLLDPSETAEPQDGFTGMLKGDLMHSDGL